MNKTQSSFFCKNKKTIIFFSFIGIFLITILTSVSFDITGSYEGIFLLKGNTGSLFELKDDLYLGDGHRYIVGVDFEKGKQAFLELIRHNKHKEPYLYYEWNEKKGEGFVRNYLPGGKQLLTCFSRFEDDFGKEASGLFVGGGLPANVREDDIVKMNQTGIAYNDGKRWFHIWCNANEAIFNSTLNAIYPSAWKYLGSKILHHDETSLVIRSNHEVIIDEIPLRIDRFAYFRAGAPYFLLNIHIKNIGNKPVKYTYLYGDDPWLGNYGSAGGNVGWSGDGLYNFVGRLDIKKYHYAGYFDYGNDAIGQGHNFTGMANFMEWFMDMEPFVYFSNGPFDIPPLSNELIPLNSNARFIGINWERTLKPNQLQTFTLAIGMAGHDPKTGFPVKPKIDLKSFP